MGGRKSPIPAIRRQGPDERGQKPTLIPLILNCPIPLILNLLKDGINDIKLADLSRR